jgi:hypothetical protein
LATRGISPAHNRHLGPREGISGRWTQLDKICGGAAPSATRCVPKSLPPLSHGSDAMSRVKLRGSRRSTTAADSDLKKSSRSSMWSGGLQAAMLPQHLFHESHRPLARNTSLVCRSMWSFTVELQYTLDSPLN